MSIIEYKNGVHEHPTGWEGIRVCVFGASKKYKQKYFRTTDFQTKEHYPPREIVKIREQAIQLHNVWLAEEQALRELQSVNISAHFMVDKRSTRPTAVIHIQAQKCINKQREGLSSSINGNLKGFHETWDRILNRYIERFEPSIKKINKMKKSKPTFESMDAERLKFNRRSDYKFSKKQLKICFER